MPVRPRRDPTDDWEQLRLLVASPEQEAYEILRPIVLFGQPTAERAQETGAAERTLRRAVARFETAGMRSLFDAEPPPSADRRRLAAGIRAAIVGLKAEYPAFGPFEIARICRERFDRAVSYHTVQQVLASSTIPLDHAAILAPSGLSRKPSHPTLNSCDGPRGLRSHPARCTLSLFARN